MLFPNIGIIRKFLSVRRYSTSQGHKTFAEMESDLDLNNKKKKPEFGSFASDKYKMK